MNKTALVSILSLFVFCLATPAFAHETREYEIGGAAYSFTVGSLGEPLVVDDKSGVDLRISRAGKPFAGAETQLAVEVTSGEAKKTFDLSAVWGEIGAYKTTFFVTTADPVSYRLVGNLEGRAIDLTFDCSPGGHNMTAMSADTSRVGISDGVTQTLKRGAFGCPALKSELQFPEKPGDLLGLEKGLSTTRILSVTALLLAVAAVILAVRGTTPVTVRVNRNTWILILVIGSVAGACALYLFSPFPSFVESRSTTSQREMAPHPMIEVNTQLPIPSATIEVSKDSMDGYNVRVIPKNFTFSPEKVGGTNIANTGHAHLYVNGIKVARLYGPWFNLSATHFTSGENTIEVTLNANDHSEWVLNGQHLGGKTTVLR